MEACGMLWKVLWCLVSHERSVHWRVLRTASFLWHHPMACESVVAESCTVVRGTSVYVSLVLVPVRTSKQCVCYAFVMGVITTSSNNSLTAIVLLCIWMIFSSSQSRWKKIGL